MRRELEVMDKIQTQKTRDIEKGTLQPLNPEGIRMAEHKRFTIDMVGTPVDPLR